MPPLRVVVSGTGRMGKEVLAAVCRDPDFEPVGVLEKFPAEAFVSLPDGSGLVHLDKDPKALFARAHPEVVIDFTNAEWTPAVARATLEAGGAAPPAPPCAGPPRGGDRLHQRRVDARRGARAPEGRGPARHRHHGPERRVRG